MKKAILALLIACLLLALTGCACKHESTELRGVVQATCAEDGYTGDTYCLECEEIVEKGSVVPARGHQLTETMNYSDSTCAREGYTGDIYCNFCGERVVTGETIAKKEHTPGELVRVREADCWDEGYTGDIDCTVCGTTIEEGEFTEALGHTPGERINVAEATCGEWGYTGDVPCATCGDIIEYGESIERLEHANFEYRDGYEATCTSNGYAGDKYCADCGDWLEYGEYIEKTAHTPGELTGVTEATCAAPGYTGDGYCTACEAFVEGQSIEKLDHTYENGVCAACGWKTAGLYIDGQLAFTWEQLVQNSYVTVNEENGLTGIVKSLYGTMVVEEGVFLDANGIFESCQLEGVWLPSSVTWIPRNTFSNNTTLGEVKIFGRLDGMDDNAFTNNTAITHFDIPAGVTHLDWQLFMNCTNLKSVTIPEGVVTTDDAVFQNTGLTSVTLPSTITKLDHYCFADCPNLTELIIPEGVTYIGDRFLQNSAVTELVLPSTVVDFGRQEYTNLTKLDLSKTVFNELSGLHICNNANLREVILPATLQTMADDTFAGCTGLVSLDLPDGFTGMYDAYWGNAMDSCTSLTTVIWPASLTDGSYLAAAPNLTTIFYKGSELQWDLTVSKDLFEGKTIIFDYVEP